MKKCFIQVIAIVIAVSMSSFSAKTVNVYLIYNSGPHYSRNSYLDTWGNPGTYSGDTYLAWIGIADDNGFVNIFEFNAAFDALDTNSDNSLDDESEVWWGTYTLEKTD